MTTQRSRLYILSWNIPFRSCVYKSAHSKIPIYKFYFFYKLSKKILFLTSFWRLKVCFRKQKNDIIMPKRYWVQWSVEFLKRNFFRNTNTKFFRNSNKNSTITMVMADWKKCFIVRKPIVLKKVLPEGFFLFILYVDAIRQNSR